MRLRTVTILASVKQILKTQISASYGLTSLLCSSPWQLPGWRPPIAHWLPVPVAQCLIRNAIMTFEPYLHWTFHDEHVLFSYIVLKSPLNFLLASLLIVLICLLERLNIQILFSSFFNFQLRWNFLLCKVFNFLPGQWLGASSIQVKTFIYVSCSLENRVVFDCNIP